MFVLAICIIGVTVFSPLHTSQNQNQMDRGPEASEAVQLRDPFLSIQCSSSAGLKLTVSTIITDSYRDTVHSVNYVL